LFLIFKKKALDLIEKILVVDPDERITCEQAIAHPFFASIRDAKHEPKSREYDNSWENAIYDENGWKSKL
jgi:serine/threonine protein kinase